MKFEIWQLPISHKNCFCGSQIFELEPIKVVDYVFVYSGEITSNSLENVFELLNVNHPKDYHARSLSVSDVICVVDGNKRDWYYVDDIGFKKLDAKEFECKGKG